jgi:DNA-binding HxlR family transcriptional regulator
MKSSKLTKARAKRPPAERWYEDACCGAHALELIGERWALLIVRELMFGPRRFSEIKAGLPGISANVLTQRLEGLERAGLLKRDRLPPPANAQVYELTQWGYEVEPIIQVMSRWAARSPDHDPSLPLSAASLMLSFRTLFDAKRAAGLNATIGFRFGWDGFVARIAGGTLTITRTDSARADAVFTTNNPMALAVVIYGGQKLRDAESTGALTVTGDRKLAEKFVTLFPLPQKVSVD